MMRTTMNDLTPPGTRISPKDRRMSPASRVVLTISALSGALLLVVLFAGFLSFINRLARFDTEFGRRADGVVALTGGAERITDALAILSEQRAQRLLITGVGERTQITDLVRQSGHAQLFSCCVDIDRAALNTVGNARETANWAKAHDYRSLLVVTSNYHMPRAMVELQRFAKKVELVPHPVIAESIKADNWWTDFALARLLFGEYLKYLVSEARSRVVPDYPERR